MGGIKSMDCSQHSTRRVKTSFIIAVRTGFKTGLVKHINNFYFYLGYYGYYGNYGCFLIKMNLFRY
jgi:hypothetical protein